ncbi:MAG: ATP-binding protein, partial [Oscillospiraceae bacterium]|nr:ATP-binding protein [Oscillospiraceae bacterium]
DVDMSFSAADIAGMLTDYESDHSTGMDIAAISQEIYNYTSGYPFLVSRICKLIDEQPLSWDIDGVERAVKLILNEKNTLFDDLFKKLHEYSSLLDILRRMLFSGISYSYNLYDPAIDLGTMFGILANNNGSLCVTNRIFETMLYNYFLFEEQNSKTYSAGALNKNQFVENGELNMDLVMQKFVEHFTEVYRDNDSTFVEENGRKLFLLYLKPIINGTGNYYIEAATRDMKRTDIVIDYLGKQFIIEMKIWHGDEYNKRGEKQLAEYLDSYKQNKGWLLSFNFNKNKKVGITTIECDGKTIVEAVV